LCAACYADLDVRRQYAPKPGGRASTAGRPEYEQPAPEPQRYFDAREYADPEARKRGYAERAARSVELFGRKDGLLPSEEERRAELSRILSFLTLPERLERLLVRQGLDAAGLAERTGLHRTSIYGYLRNKWKPSYRAARKLAGALGVSVEELLGEERGAALAVVR
jgi:hypothetical protein